MKVQLVVAQGVHTGKEIPITANQFVIGRDAQCQLRPASPAISKKHCAVIIRGKKVYVQDFDSTNGTCVNGEPVKGEVEVRDKDRLKVGPLEFTVSVSVAAPAPAPVKKPAAASQEEDSFAALLLEGDAGAATVNIPEGSTEMEILAVKPPEGKDAAKKDAKQPAASTSNAAAEILKKYTQRPRS